MPVKIIDPVAQPFVRGIHVPDVRSLAQMLEQRGQLIGAGALQRGQGAAATWQGLAQAFGQYQQAVQQRQMQAQALAMREQERAAAEQLKRDEMAMRAAERQQEAARFARTDDRLARTEQRQIEEAESAGADRLANNTLPGVVPSAMADRLKPSGRVQVLDGAPVLMRTPVQARQAEIDKAAAADRAADNLRADQMLKVAQQNANTARLNADTSQRRYGSSGVDVSGLPPDYADALDSALMTFPATRRGPVIAQASRVVGDPERMAEVLQQATLAGENVDARNQVNGRRAILAALASAKRTIADLKKSGVPTNWLTGTAEDLARKLGTTTDPRLVALKTELMDAVVQYRRAATGVAFSERESADYARMFPNYSQTMPVNEAVIDGLSRAMRTNDRSYWEGRLGKKGAALVMGEDTTKKANPNR